MVIYHGSKVFWIYFSEFLFSFDFQMIKFPVYDSSFCGYLITNVDLI